MPRYFRSVGAKFAVRQEMRRAVVGVEASCVATSSQSVKGCEKLLGGHGLIVSFLLNDSLCRAFDG